MTTTRPIPIPRDLKPGTKLICSDGVTRVFMIWDDRPNTNLPVGTEDGHWFTRKGVSCLGDRVVIRIERIASKARKAKVDKDAKWLLHGMNVNWHPTSKEYRRIYNRIRAIARRLNGGGK